MGITKTDFMGTAFSDKVYDREPAESYKRIIEHLKKILPGADEKAIRKLLK